MYVFIYIFMADFVNGAIWSLKLVHLKYALNIHIEINVKEA